MRYSGVEWIGEIPDKWELNKIGQLFNFRNEKVSDKVYQALSVSKGGVVSQMESVAKSDASDDRKLVLAGDFAINSRSDRKMSCGVSPLDGSVSLINTILYPKNPNVIYNDYMNYLLKNYGFAEEFYRWGHGIVADLWTTKWQEMKDIILPLPSLEMQKKIFDFLNKKTAEIDSLIEIENQQIEKLKEYKQTVITEAVTKGLDKNAAMKDSGIDWIGDIPLNWSIQKFKNFGECRNGLTYSPADMCMEEGGILVLRSSNIQNNKLVFDDNVYVNCSIKEELFVKKNDILICSRNGSAKLIGKNVLIPDNLHASFGAFMMIYRCCDPIYLRYILCSSIFFQYLGTFLTVSVNQLTGSNFMNISFPYPKEKAERLKIIKYLDEKCAEIDALIAIKQKKIDDLNEYKKSLIYECVTGKKEVAE